jgi:6-phosphogluconolactonase (cycloisomerase 2 family)
VHFSIATNGTLAKQETITLAAAPVALTVNQANNYLYVVYGTTSATLAEYPLSNLGVIGAATSSQSLTLPANPADTVVPTGVTVLANNNNVYVSAYDASAYNPGGTPTSSANPGWVFGFAVGSGGSLTATGGSPYKAGVKPSGISGDPVNRFLYVTDFASNELIGYAIQSGGVLNFLVNGPFKTGNEPTGIVVDPRGIYIYIPNALDSSITGFNIALPTGTPSAIVNSNSSLVYATDTQPVAIAVDPALGRFFYTANHLGNSISGFRLDPTTGAAG